MNNEEIKIEEKSTETIETTIDNKTSESGAVLPQVEPTKHAGGRPTDYKKEFCDKVDEYLEQSVDKELSVIKETKNVDGSIDTQEVKRQKVQLPTIEGLALFLGVSLQTIYNWGEIHEEFLESLEKIKKVQKERLLNEGLAGNYNSTIAKLILSSNHGMAENTHTDITSKGKSLNTPVTIVFKDMSKEE